MVGRPKIVLEPNSHGGLLLWQEPLPGHSYVIGADTAGGLMKGDFAAAIVIEAKTCDIVARWKERQDPHKWGPACALLAWHYNEAVLAFETGASTHGLTADTEARAAGYTNLYVHVRTDRVSRDRTEQRGWFTNVATKAPMIDRVKKAIEANAFIPDYELLMELRDQQTLVNEHGDLTGKMGGSKHDDLMMAYAISLCVRDLCWSRGTIRTEAAKPRDESERYWAAEERRIAAEEKSRLRRTPRKLRCG